MDQVPAAKRRRPVCDGRMRRSIDKVKHWHRL
jgi:hypothetical protein